ncbi:MAG: AMP-binding protein [Deltaproteobacteria bacterium]|nr:AMP-binding protein [Deltaproteobacteria bacterium]
MAEIPSLGAMLAETARRLGSKEALIFEGRTISYRELDEQAGRTANALAALGIRTGDRVAIMLPNIPEFVYTFYGLQKLGAVAVPFNTMYKGREITHILNDSGARAIVALTGFANLINEIKTDVPGLEHIILTGQRTLLFAQEGATVFVQMVFDAGRFASSDAVFKATGAVLVSALKRLGVDDAWYKHQGSIRCDGKKIASILLSTFENLFIVNALVCIDRLEIDTFFKAVGVPPEVKDKVLEPMTSVREQTGSPVTIAVFRDAFMDAFQQQLDADIVSGSLSIIERFAYRQARRRPGEKIPKT